jgi:ABC-2 type transport system ATP-binding protein
MEYTQRLEEIRLCLHNEDLNRAGQRLLDLCYDFPFEDEVRERSLLLRQQYNEGKQLGRTRNTNESLYTEYKLFYESLLKFPFSDSLTDLPKKTLARATEIGKTFRSRLHNFKFAPLSLELIEGKIIGLVGENGNGKTTLLRMIAGDLATDKGDIEYIIDNEVLRDWQEIKKHVAFIPQRLERWYGNANDKISFEAAIKGFKGEENAKKVNFILHRMGLTNFRELSWTELSSGYKLRFEIAMALVWEPKILILDEPLANLDIQAQELLLQDLRNLADSRRNPVSIVLSSQQLHEVETVADQIIFLKNGNAVYNGALADFRKNDKERTFELSGTFSYNDLQILLKDWDDIRIEQTVSTFTISCSEKHSKEELFNLMLQQGLSIDYFRNISGSTKKLFSDKY